MENFDPSAYSLVVQKARIDDHEYFVGRALEFPDVEVYEESQEEAYKALTDIISTLKIAADRNGKQLPLPISHQSEEDEYSGRVTLRLGKTLHRKVAQTAHAEGVSLNTHIATVLAESVGEKSGKPSTPIFVQHIMKGQTILSTGHVGDQAVVMLGSSGGSTENFSRRN
jgi:hypothetical protein